MTDKAKSVTIQNRVIIFLTCIGSKEKKCEKLFLL